MVHWYQQCVTLHHVPKWMSCHKDTVVTTGWAHCFHDYIMPIFFCIIWAVWVLWITYDKSLQFILPYSLMKTLWFIGITNGHHKAIVVILMVILMSVHCFHDYIYICIYLYIYYIYIWCIIIYMMDTHIQKHATSIEQ